MSVQFIDYKGSNKQNEQIVPAFVFELHDLASTKITYPGAKEKPLLEICSAELAGATETSVLEG